MKKTSCAFILFFALVILTLTSIMQYGRVQADTNVTGIISSDTTWTKANSPYSLSGPVSVPEGVNLMIEAGVTVNLNSYYIQVNGTLSARGSGIDKIHINDGSNGVDGRGYPIYPITFTPFSMDWIEQNETGCIIENTVLYTTTITINASPKICNNSFVDSFIAISSSWSGSGAGHYNASPIISNNTFNGGGISTFYSGGLISNNIVSGCYIGIQLRSDTSTIVERNLIIDNAEGIQLLVHQGPVSPIIRNNTITENSYGISISRQFTAPTSPVIIFNNIYSNTNYNVNSGVPDNVNATFNWWGTTDTEAINQTIRDYYEDFNLGIVNFTPFLSELNSGAPTIPTFIITASAGTGGSITPSGDINVLFGVDQTFTVTANNGYQIVSVLMDGVPATAPFTFTNVIAAHTISATFELVPTLSPSPSPSSSPTPSPTPKIPEFSSWTILPLLTFAALIATIIYFKKRKGAYR